MREIGNIVNWGLIAGGLWLNGPMAKRKSKPFKVASVVKAASRAVLGTPPPVRRAENKKRQKKEKHKASLGKLLADADRG